MHCKQEKETSSSSNYFSAHTVTHCTERGHCLSSPLTIPLPFSICKLLIQPVALFSHAFSVVQPSLPISHVLSMLLGQAVKSPPAWSTHTTVRLSCQDITTFSPDYWCNSITSNTSPCMPPANLQSILGQVSPNDTTIFFNLPMFTTKPLTSRLASSMVWVVRVTSSWQLIFSAVALSNWAVRLWRLASRSYRNKRRHANQTPLTKSSF